MDSFGGGVEPSRAENLLFVNFRVDKDRDCGALFVVRGGEGAVAGLWEGPWLSPLMPCGGITWMPGL